MSSTTKRIDESEHSRGWDDGSDYAVEYSPLSSPDRGITRQRLAHQIRGEVKRLKIELPPSVIRKYLDDGKSSLSELRDVKSLREVTERAEVIVRVCRAPPVQAFYYCIDFPNGTPAGYLDLKRKANLAFHLEGMRIMHMLTEEDREKLVDTPLSDVLSEFRKRDSRLMIRSVLRRIVDNKVALEILSDSATQSRISISGEESALAMKLLEFWRTRGDSQSRKAKLESEFRKYGMTMRSSCPFCAAFIEGKVDADLEDVVGISVVASRLRGRRKKIPKYLPACEEELRKFIHHRTVSLEEAVREAMRATKVTDRLPRLSTPDLLEHCTQPSNYLPFSVMVLRQEITLNEA